MAHDAATQRNGVRMRTRCLHFSSMLPLVAGILTIGASPATSDLVSPAIAQAEPVAQLPSPPANGVMGFVIYDFVPSVIPGKDACPEGPARKNREIFLSSLPPAEAERIAKAEYKEEFGERWRDTLMRADGTNICSQYTQFPDRPLQRTVQSKFAWGLNLDGDEGDGSSNPQGCAHQNFETPDGMKGIDNQAYRAMGCNLEWRDLDGGGGDLVVGSKKFIASGEWTQVLLLHGVDSLVNDDDVDIVYGNTPDRPVVDSTGKYIWNTSFTISTKMPRERNVLKGKIVNGVLTTAPTLIKLAYTWGQSAARDLRGIRSKWTFNRGQLRLTFQPDGTLKGIVAGYEPLNEFIDMASMGGMGSAMVAGIDCAGVWNTLKKHADGDRDPRTGECKTISSAYDLVAVPAFVNDIPSQQKSASR